jgi:tetratricopeptide (TPR) repeat protein
MAGIRRLLAASLVLAVAACITSASCANASVPARESHADTRDIGRMHRPDVQRGAMFALSCMVYLSENLLPQALEACNRAIDADPTDAQALRLRGSVFLVMRERDLAILDFSISIDIEPSNAAGYDLRGRAHYDAGNLSDAVADFSRSIALEPGDADAYDARGSALQAMGRYGDAIADFGSAIVRAPADAGAWNARCWVRMVANTALPAALADCAQAIRLDPGSSHPYDSLGWVYLRMNDPRNAIRNFDAALERTPKLPTSLYGRGLARMALGDNGHGARDIAAARALQPGIAERFGSYGFPVPRRLPRMPNRAGAETAS